MLSYQAKQEEEEAMDIEMLEMLQGAENDDLMDQDMTEMNCENGRNDDAEAKEREITSLEKGEISSAFRNKSENIEIKSVSIYN